MRLPIPPLRPGLIRLESVAARSVKRAIRCSFGEMSQGSDLEHCADWRQSDPDSPIAIARWISSDLHSSAIGRNVTGRVATS